MQPLLPRHTTRPRPAGWVMPRPATPEFWRAWADGYMTDDEAETAQAAFYARSERAKDARRKMFHPQPRRWENPEPRRSNQYAGPTATTAARDRRLTPGAVRCLHIIRAFCGRRGFCQTMKAVLARELGVSKRTVQRYIRDLVTFKYLAAQTTKDEAGYFTGLYLTILEAVLPARDHGRAWVDAWVARMTGATRSEADERPAFLPLGVETILTSKKGFLDKTLPFIPRGRCERRGNYLLLT